MAVSMHASERRVEKSAQAFRTISEVATELDVPQHVLRFWESKFSQVRPLKRGGGRRYYRPEDIDLLRRIRTLLYDDGYTIKGVQRLLKEGRGRLPQQRLDLAAESALESLRIVSARAEAMAGGSTRQPLPRTGPQPSTTTPRAAASKCRGFAWPTMARRSEIGLPTIGMPEITVETTSMPWRARISSSRVASPWITLTPGRRSLR